MSIQEEYYKQENAALREQVRILTEGLNFYAIPFHWHTFDQRLRYEDDYHDGQGLVFNGRRAIEALARVHSMKEEGK